MGVSLSINRVDKISAVSADIDEMTRDLNFLFESAMYRELTRIEPLRNRVNSTESTRYWPILRTMLGLLKIVANLNFVLKIVDYMFVSKRKHRNEHE